MRKLLLFIALPLFFSQTDSSAPDSEQLGYNLGQLKLQCPEPLDAWLHLGPLCVKFISPSNAQDEFEPDSGDRWNWTGAVAHCRRSENNNSELLHLTGWAMHRQLTALIPALTPTPSDNGVDREQALYWTGWYLDLLATTVFPPNHLPTQLFTPHSNDTSAELSIYSPLWADNEPRLAHSNGSTRTGRWCVAWNAQNSPANYGWHLRDCSERWPIICQTFACFDGEHRCSDNSRCIPEGAVCDGVVDCIDASDELPTSCPSATTAKTARTFSYSGYIHSPGYEYPFTSSTNATSANDLFTPEGYSHQWIISEHTDRRVTLHFLDVKLPPGDALLVEGPASGERLELFNITLHTPFTYSTTSNEVLISYRSAAATPDKTQRRVGGSGFSLHYVAHAWTECYQRFASWNGSFAPPLTLSQVLPAKATHRPGTTSCMWTVDNAEQSIITIKISSLNLSHSEWLAVYDGPIDHRSLFGNFTRLEPNTSTLGSPSMAYLSNAKEINFLYHLVPPLPTDPYGDTSVGAHTERSGFGAAFERSCSAQHLTALHGTVESLNYRFDERKKGAMLGYSCSWELTAPAVAEGTRTKLGFTLILDYLEMKDSDEFIIEFDGVVTHLSASMAKKFAELSYRCRTGQCRLRAKHVSSSFLYKFTFTADCTNLTSYLTQHSLRLLVEDDSAKDSHPYKSRLLAMCAIGHDNTTYQLVCEKGGKWELAAPVGKSCRHSNDSTGSTEPIPAASVGHRVGNSSLSAMSEPACIVPNVTHGFVTRLDRAQGALWYGCDYSYAPLAITESRCMTRTLKSAKNGPPRMAEWSPKPECKEITCPVPALISPLPTFALNSSRHTSASLGSLAFGRHYGSRAIYGCNETRGEALTGGVAFIQCGANGKWKPEDSALACAKPGCFPTKIRFGSMANSWTPVGGLANITCLRGLEHRTRAPRCIEAASSAAWDMSHGRGHCEFINACQQKKSLCGAHGMCRPVNESYSCECSPGYRYNAANARCEVIDQCAKGTHLCSGDGVKCVFNASTADYTCICGEEQWLIDTEDGKHHALLPSYNASSLLGKRTCIRARCPARSPPIPWNATVLINGSALLLAGTSAQVHCPNTTGAVEIRCAADKRVPLGARWNSKWPAACRKTTCSLPTLNNDTFVKTPSANGEYTINDVVEFCCRGQCSADDSSGQLKEDSEYVMIGPRALICRADGQWNGLRPSCTLPQCSALPSYIPTLDLSIGIDSPRKTPFAAGTNATFQCLINKSTRIIVGNATCQRTNHQNGTIAMQWAGENTYPDCGKVKKRLVCEITGNSIEEDVVPSTKIVGIGSEVNFTCRQPNYALSGGSMCIFNKRNNNVLIPASSPLFCHVSAGCLERGRKVHWVRELHGVNSTLQSENITFRSGDFLSTTLDSSSNADHDDTNAHIRCELRTDEGEVVDYASWKVNSQNIPNAESWKMDILKSTGPVLTTIFDSRGVGYDSHAGWRHSAQWRHDREGRWHFSADSNTSNNAYLIAPVVVGVKSDWLEVTVDIVECMSKESGRCTVELSYYSATKAPDEHDKEHQPPPSSFNQLGDASMEPDTHSIHFVLPHRNVWIMVRANAADASFTLNSLRLRVTACPKISLGHRIFPQTVVSHRNTTVRGECINSEGASRPSSRPTHDREPGLICSPIGVWMVERPSLLPLAGLCICNSTRLPLDPANCLPVKDDLARLNADKLVRLSDNPPVCLDMQAANLTCTATLKVRQLSPTFTEPTAVPLPIVVDNDPNFRLTSLPPIHFPLHSFDPYHDKTIRWRAEDRHGITAECTTKLEYVDGEPPTIQCPDSPWLDKWAGLEFQPSTVPIRLPLVTAVDRLSSVMLTYEPANGTQTALDQPMLINVTGRDAAGNAANCPFWYTAVAADCPSWAITDGKLSTEEFWSCDLVNDTITTCTPTAKDQCKKGKRLWPFGLRALRCEVGSTDGWQVETVDGTSTKLAAVPQCFETELDSATSAMSFSFDSHIIGGSECIQLTADSLKSLLLTQLTEQCAKNNWQFASFSHVNTYRTAHVSLNYTSTTLHNSSQLLMECAAKLDNQSSPMALSRLLHRDASLAATGCRATIKSQSISHRLHCPEGWESLNQGDSCGRCPPGHQSAPNSTCIPCAVGTYATQDPSAVCTPCPEGTSTKRVGALSDVQCTAMCPPGAFSADGLAPCRPCPKGHYQPKAGQSRCYQCEEGLTTLRVGSTSTTDCRSECASGSFLHPLSGKCLACPPGHYQARPHSSTCEKCAVVTLNQSDRSDWRRKCGAANEGGVKAVRCPTGWTGVERNARVNLCHAALCLNGGRCEFSDADGNVCHCPSGFNGTRCEKQEEYEAASSKETSDDAKPKAHLNWPSCTEFSSINPCPNGACINGECVCNADFTFDRVTSSCAPVDVCDRVWCLNAGKCLSSSASPIGDFTCACPPESTTGRFCEHSRSNCSSLTACLNGGTCVYDSFDTPTNSTITKCVCQGGFIGHLCENAIDNACTDPVHGSGGPCLNGGACVPFNAYSAADFYCQCRAGFLGEFCEKAIDPCSSEAPGALQCHNGGRCRRGDGTDSAATCECVADWTGPDCTSRPDYCLQHEDSHCMNGGRCHNFFSRAVCECPEGFVGERCEVSLDTCPDRAMACGQQGRCQASLNSSNNSLNCPCDSAELHGLSSNCPMSVASEHNCSSSNRCDPVGTGRCLPLAPFITTNSTSLRRDFCACRPGFWDAICSSRADYCSLERICLNNGTCVGNATGYACVCPDGFRGANCERAVDPCVPNPCANGGDCLLDPNGTGRAFTCRCRKGWEASTHCTSVTDPCTFAANKGYCKNGGSCRQLPPPNDRSIYCQCPSNVTGQQCEREKDKDYILHFSGRGDKGPPATTYIRSSRSIAIAELSKGFTLCGWVNIAAKRRDSQASSAPFLTVLELTTSSTLLQLSQARLELMLINATVEIPFSLSASVWHHLCLVAEQLQSETGGLDWHYYVNGKLAGSNRSDEGLPDGRISIVLDEAQRFAGEISLVQLYGAPLNAVAVKELAENCLRPDFLPPPLLLSWSEFSSASELIIGVIAIQPGICSTASCQPGTRDCHLGKDKRPPRVFYCPEDKFLVAETTRFLPVQWNDSVEEMFADDEGPIAAVEANFRSGQSFAWGEYHVVYRAVDAAGNAATCEFDIVVAPSRCVAPSLAESNNYTTLASIRPFSGREASQIAELQCLSDDNNYVFNQAHRPFYVCDTMGRWDRSHRLDAPFPLPSCSQTRTPVQQLSGSVQFVECSARTHYEAKLKEAVVKASHEVGLLCFAKGTCLKDLDINSTCPTGQRRTRRDSEEQPHGEEKSASLFFTLTVNSTLQMFEPVLIDALWQAFATNFTSLPPRYSCRSDDYPYFHTSKALPALVMCSTCTAGETWEDSAEEGQNGGKCVKCPENTYKTGEGVRPCTPCPVGSVTGNVTGCVGEGDCYQNCTAGHFYDYGQSRCVKCPKGTYMPYSGRLRCFACPLQSTTSTTGAVDVADCSAKCRPGEEMSPEEECTKCELGTFRSEVMDHCQRCPLGFTTNAMGSQSLAECGQVSCPAGYYKNPQLGVAINEPRLLDVCLECPPGYYQPLPNSTKCDQCPVGSTTAQPRSRAITDCSVNRDLSCEPDDPNPCQQVGWRCIETSNSKDASWRYECRDLSAIIGVAQSPSQVADSTLWLLLAVCLAAALLFTAGAVTGVRYRKKWLFTLQRYCPQWVVCCGTCAKMSVNELSTSDYTRDEVNMPVTRDAARPVDGVRAAGRGEEIATGHGTAVWPRDEPPPEDPINDLRSNFFEILGTNSSSSPMSADSESQSPYRDEVIPLAELRVKTRDLKPAKPKRQEIFLEETSIGAENAGQSAGLRSRSIASSDYARSTSAIGRRIMAMNELGDEVEYFGIRRSSPRVVYACSPAVHNLDALEMSERRPSAACSQPTNDHVNGAVKDYDDDDDAFFS